MSLRTLNLLTYVLSYLDDLGLGLGEGIAEEALVVDLVDVSKQVSK